MKVRIKKLNENAVIPYKAHETDAGFDLVATSVKLDENGCVVYGTGLAFEIPKGYVGLLFPRSSNAKKDLILTNCVGVLDAGYRGEVLFKYKPSLLFIEEDMVALASSLSDSRIYKVGDRVGQLIIMPLPVIEFEEASELSDTERGDGGYGSSGV